MRNTQLRTCWFVILLLVGVSQSLHAQVRTIRGTVTSGSETLIGVSVQIKGTTTGTITDLDGNYSLSVNGNKDVLIFSYIGYQTQEVAVKEQNVINVILTEDSKTLDEVVVVGFGTQKKVNLTGSVSMIDAKELEQRPVQNVVQALQGKIPGLNISASGNVGELNGSSSINIRGTGTIGNSSGAPLVLIDGMEGNMRELNPQDIENISVLKDAAASSIYGSRAPFGVVLITTKKGKEGTVKINYNSEGVCSK